jgi:DNA polymerase-3 subunit delta
LVLERSKQLRHTLLGDAPNPFCLSEFGFDAIKSDLGPVNDAIFSLSFGGGIKLIRIQQTPTTAPAPFLALLDSLPSQVIVIVESAELLPSSSLRKYFEFKPNAAAIACYHDEAQSIREITAATLNTNGFRIHPAALQLFCEMVYGDRLAIRQEVEKLMLYMGDAKQIEESDILAAIAPSAESSIDHLCHLFFSGQNAKAMAAFKVLEGDGVGVITILRSFLKYTQRLEGVLLQTKSGVSQESALMALKPPIFFKYAPLFKQALASWSLPKLHAAYGALLQLEVECKRNLLPPTLLLSKWMLDYVPGKTAAIAPPNALFAHSSRIFS